MSETLSFAEIEQQRVELLPARTVLSLFVASGGSACGATTQAGGAAGTFGAATGNAIGALGIPIDVGGGTGNAGGPISASSC
jgi:hypothetical protein